ncbi:MAG: chemotaxis protein CheA [Eubacterium sp.]|jgi:two-component system chemotaxis sensor kinase CheA|nr:chemotaxis protein CheA [Eubacterium sp.]
MDAGQYLDTFKNETGEHLENLRECIAALEKEPGSKSTIDEIVRTSHSLKGMAGIMGFPHMRHLAGRIEDVSQKVQDGSVIVTGRMIDALSEGLDALNKYLETIKKTSGEGPQKNEALLKELNDLLTFHSNNSLPAETGKKLPEIRKKSDTDLHAAVESEQKAKPVVRKASPNNPATVSTVHVDIEKLDALMNQVSELIIIKNRLVSIHMAEGESAQNQVLHDGIEYLENITANLHESIMQVRMVPIESVINKFPRMMRDLARKLDKKIELYMSGGDTNLDRTVVDQIGVPLWHLLRNAAEHGIESREIRWQRGKHEKGAVYLNVYQEDGNVIIHIRDDGNGIDIAKVQEHALSIGLVTPEQVKGMEEKEIINLIFHRTYSTVNQERGASVRGSGLYVVRSAIEALGGDIEVFGMPLQGARFTVRLPAALTIMRAVLVGIRQEKYAIAIRSILSIEDIESHEIFSSGSGEEIQLRGMSVPLLHPDEILGMEPRREDKRTYKVVVVKKGDKYAGLIVDSLMEEQEIVIKSLGKFIRTDKRISGATILGDGEVALILDVNAFI